MHLPLSQILGSCTRKPDALSRQSVSDHWSPTPETIMLGKQVVRLLIWQIEKIVKQALQQHLYPGTRPPLHLFFSGHCLLPGLAEGPLLPVHLLFREGSDHVPHLSLLLVAISGLGHAGFCGGPFYVEQSPITGSNSALTPSASPHRPWPHIALDFVTGLLVPKGNAFILTVVDYFSKAIPGIGPPLCCCIEAVIVK